MPFLIHKLAPHPWVVHANVCFLSAIQHHDHLKRSVDDWGKIISALMSKIKAC